MRKIIPACLLFCLLLSSCGGDFIYEKTADVPNQSWAYEDTLKFEFDIEDTTKIYSLLLDVKHSQEYGFQNLYVQIHTGFPSGKAEKQVLSLELAGKAGVWNGECGSKSCTVEIPLQMKAIFKETGKHTLAIEQYMRKSPLPGVESMTLKVK